MSAVANDVGAKLSDAEEALREIAKVRVATLDLFEKKNRNVKPEAIVEADESARKAISDVTALEADLREMKGAALACADEQAFVRYRETIARAEFLREALESLVKSWTENVAAARKQIEREKASADLESLAKYIRLSAADIDAQYPAALQAMNELLDLQGDLMQANRDLIALATQTGRLEAEKKRANYCTAFSTVAKQLYDRLDEVYGAKPVKRHFQ